MAPYPGRAPRISEGSPEPIFPLSGAPRYSRPLRPRVANETSIPRPASRATRVRVRLFTFVLRAPQSPGRSETTNIEWPFFSGGAPAVDAPAPGLGRFSHGPRPRTEARRQFSRRTVATPQCAAARVSAEPPRPFSWHGVIFLRRLSRADPVFRNDLQRGHGVPSQLPAGPALVLLFGRASATAAAY